MGAFVQKLAMRVAPMTQLLSKATRSPVADESGLLPESGFLRLLSLERKRSERSRQPFVLMLLEPDPLAEGAASDGLLQPLASTLLGSIRETDIAGWYGPRALGVIFAELGPATKAAVVEALLGRITAALEKTLGADRAGRIRITFHWFPEDWKERDTDRAGALYPDLAQREAGRKLPLAIKRAVDVTGSLLALIVLGPLLLAIALVIKVSSPGPVIFRQARLGQHGLPFTMFKFRSMYAESDSTPHVDFIKRFIAGEVNGSDATPQSAVYKLTEDVRVTSIGRFLRRTSLDELPQLFNVIRGEMSLVGPRPPIRYELDQYDLWHRRRLLEAKPGITGLWQVTGRSSLRFDDMVRLDLEYATAWSLWLDLKILLRTARVVLSGVGAY